MKLFGLGLFFVGRFLITKATPLSTIGPIRFSNYSRVTFGSLCLSGNMKFYFIYLICLHIVVHAYNIYYFIIIFTSVMLVVMFPLSFLMLVIFCLSSFLGQSS